MPTWLVIGAGRCGLQLARGVAAAGLRLAGVVTRSDSSRRRARRLLPDIPVTLASRPLPPASHWLIAVPDGSLADLALTLARSPRPGPRVALHTSGLLPGEVLAPLRGRAGALGSFHPLLSFPAPGGALVHTAGAVAAIEGDRAAVAAARSLARTLGMHPVLLAPADKPRYHAAAVLAANLTYALVAEARTQLAASGVPRHLATVALAALTASAMRAVLAARGWERMSGPLTRGDAASLKAHLAGLPGDAAAAYRAVSALAVTRLHEGGVIDETTAERELVALTESHRYASFGPDEGP